MENMHMLPVYLRVSDSEDPEFLRRKALVKGGDDNH